jgi:hypothetical protein
MPLTGQLGTVDSMYANLMFGGPVALTEIPQVPMLLCEINWDDNPTLEFPPTGYTDVSNRVRAFSTRRGRNNFVDRVETGTAVVALDNRDGYFNFTQPGRLLMRKVRLRAFYNNTFFPLLTGHIESFRYSYPGVDADAICEITIADGMKVLAQQVFPTDYVRENETPIVRLASALTEAGIGDSYQSLNATYIATDEVAPVRVVQTAVPIVQTRAATLTNGSATIVVDTTAGIAVGQAVTGVGIPVGCVVDTIVDPTHFTIRNDSNPANGFAFISRLKDTVYNGHPGPWTELDGIADTSDLSVGMTVGPRNDNNGTPFFQTGTVITAIESDKVFFYPPSSPTANFRGSGDPGGVMTAVPFTSSATQTLTFVRNYLTVAGILEHIRQMEATERGLFLVLADGIYEYQGSGWRPAQSVQLTFGENTGAGEVPYKEVPIVFDDTNLTNEYNLHNVYNDTYVQITDATSQARYFRRSQTIDQQFYLTVSSLPTDQRVLEPIPRLEGLTIEPAADPLTLWPKVLALVISNKVGVRRRPMGAADIFASYDQFIEAVEHDAVPGDWKVKFITSPVRT